MGNSKQMIVAICLATGSQNLKGEFIQEDFENLLAEWIVTCDQPFDEVDKQPFHKMLEYAH